MSTATNLGTATLSDEEQRRQRGRIVRITVTETDEPNDGEHQLVIVNGVVLAVSNGWAPEDYAAKGSVPYLTSEIRALLNSLKFYDLQMVTQ